LLKNTINMAIIYKPYVLINLTGNTTDYSISSSAITSDIYISSGFTLNITEFDKNIISRVDIINNIINYVSDGINKYMLNLLIVSNSGETSGVTQTGQYCIQISYNNEVIDYLIMSVGTTLILANSGTTSSSGTSSGITNIFDFPIIYYNDPISGTSWIGSGTTIPHNVFLHLGIGWSLDELKMLFIKEVIDCFDGNIPLSAITFLLFKKDSNVSLFGILEFGIYDIYISFTDNSGNNITNYILNIIVDDEPPIIVYKPYVISSGTTSGFTFNLFYKNMIDRIDIINNVINYVYDNIDNSINKYMLNILISNSGGTYTGVTQIGDYDVKISISDNSGNEIINYFIMSCIYDPSGTSFITYIPIIDLVYSGGTDTSIVLTGIDVKKPIIFYNNPISGTSWLGSGTTIPYDIFLNLMHDNFCYSNPIQCVSSGWTLESLKYLFISGIIDCFDGNISLSDITFLLFRNGSSIPLTGITEFGIYNVYISYTDNSGNNTTNYISNIVVNDSPPIIAYRPYVISPNLTGNTTFYSGATSAITSGIYISSGFTLNIGGFDHNIIDRIDIIDNIVNYVYDYTDIDINKYMIDILIVGSHNDNGPIIYTGVTQPGEYLVKLSLKDTSGNEIINYLMMKTIYDVSVYSEGYWQDNKVWVDFVLWLDHPIIPER